MTVSSQVTSTKVSEIGSAPEATLIPSTFMQLVPSSEKVSCLSIFFILCFVFLIQVEVIWFRYREKKLNTENYKIKAMLATESFLAYCYWMKFT